MGTSNSRIAIYRNQQVEIIANGQGKRITPSYVAFAPEGERLIGDAAKNQLTSSPESESAISVSSEISAMVLGKMREIAVSHPRVSATHSSFVPSFARCRKHTLERRSLTLLSPFLLTSMMLNVKPQKMLVPSQA